MPVDKYVYIYVNNTAFFYHMRFLIMVSKRTLILSFSSLFLLAGCGEGFEPVKTNTIFPYGNARTAGSGVAYVLAKMLPEKELKLEVSPVERDWKPEVKEILPRTKAPEPQPVPAVEPTKADEIFHDHGKK